MRYIHPVEKLLPSVVAEEMPGVMPSAVIIIIEYYTSEGKPELQFLVDDRSTPWCNLGMLETTCDDMRHILRDNRGDDDAS